jgi:small subunit ribosomal protein S19
MSRSVWKNNFLAQKFLKKNVNKKKQSILKIWNRNSVIPFFLIGRKVAVHNGKQFQSFTITRSKIGFKFGEFSYTRTYSLPKKKKKK